MLSKKLVSVTQLKYDVLVEKHPLLTGDSQKFQESRRKLPVTSAGFEKVQKTSYLPVK